LRGIDQQKIVSAGDRFYKGNGPRVRAHSTSTGPSEVTLASTLELLRSANNFF
jgi:hypothetical protein